MKSQPINRPEQRKQPLVIDLQRPPKDKTMRTVIFVEMGDMTPEQFGMLAAKFSQEHVGAGRGDHFFCPVRNGQISSDPYFEGEFLDIVQKTCEVKDGQIVLKGDVTPVKVVREFVGA